MVRTRTAAAALVNAGSVRLNGARVTAASRPVKSGDVVTIALDRAVRIMKVTGFAERRGQADPNSPFAKLAALKEQLESNKER